MKPEHIASACLLVFAKHSLLEVESIEVKTMYIILEKVRHTLWTVGVEEELVIWYILVHERWVMFSRDIATKEIKTKVQNALTRRISRILNANSYVWVVRGEGSMGKNYRSSNML